MGRYTKGIRDRMVSNGGWTVEGELIQVSTVVAIHREVKITIW